MKTTTTQSPPRQLEGLWLSLSCEESEYLRQRIEDEGYEWGATGVKEFLFDVLDEEEEDKKPGPEMNVAEQIRDFLVNNPQAVNMAGAAARGLVGKMFKMKKAR